MGSLEQALPRVAAALAFGSGIGKAQEIWSSQANAGKSLQYDKNRLDDHVSVNYFSQYFGLMHRNQ